jgi:hypothetical protein
MARRVLQQRSSHESVEPVPDSANPVVVASPGAIVRGPDGHSTWVARCPRCSDRNDESIVAGNEEHVRAQCQTCGAIVEVRESGIYRTTPTTPPPKD